MRTSHLTEQEIQDYVVQESNDIEILTHVTRCAQCRLQVNTYKDVIQYLAESPAPGLGFTAEELLPVNFGRVRQSERVERWFMPAIIAGTVLSLVVGLCLLWPYLHFIFTGISSPALIAGSAVGFMLMVAGLMELLNSYQRNIEHMNRQSTPTKLNIHF